MNIVSALCIVLVMTLGCEIDVDYRVVTCRKFDAIQVMNHLDSIERYEVEGAIIGEGELTRHYCIY